MKLLPAPDGMLLVLVRVSRWEGALHWIAADRARAARLGGACWNDVAVGPRGEVWATNGQGLARLDAGSGERRVWRYLQRGHSSAAAVVVDRDGDPWVLNHAGALGGGDASALMHLSRDAEVLEEWEVDLDRRQLVLPPAGPPLASYDRLAWGPDGRRWRLWAPGGGRREWALFTAPARAEEHDETRLALEEEPQGMAAGPEGSVWLAFPTRLVRLEPGGRALAEVGLPGAPQAVCADGAGGVWTLLGPAPGGVVRLRADGGLVGATSLGEGWRLEGLAARPSPSSPAVPPPAAPVRPDAVGWDQAEWATPPALPEASPERLREAVARAERDIAWSGGQVSRPYALGRQGKAEAGGLYCGVIFGGPRPDRCACGRLHDARCAGEVCSGCKTTLLGAHARAVRLGHVSFPEPVQVQGPGGELTLSRLPVTPAALRRPDDPLNARYQEVIKAANAQAQVSKLQANAFLRGQARGKLVAAVEALLREASWAPYAFLLLPG